MALNDRFRAKFAKRINKSKNKFELFVQKMVLEMDKRLVLRSPVDTGRFRANWVVGNGSVNHSTKESFIAADNSIEINSLKVNGQVIYLTNSLPYANRLEYGWSKQAPGGMTRLTAIEASQIARKVGIEVRAV
jgi:hypothetical protein